MIMKKVILLGTPFFTTELRSSLSDASIEASEYIDGTIIDDALYVYYGDSVKDKTPNYAHLSLAELAQKKMIVPIIKDLNEFYSFIPNELAAINAISIELK